MTATQLRAARKRLGLSQSGLAEALSDGEQRINVGTVSRWERGARPIPPLLGKAIAHLACERPG